MRNVKFYDNFVKLQWWMVRFFEKLHSSRGRCWSSLIYLTMIIMVYFLDSLGSIFGTFMCSAFQVFSKDFKIEIFFAKTNTKYYLNGGFIWPWNCTCKFQITAKTFDRRLKGTILKWIYSNEFPEIPHNFKKWLREIVK